jgi:hypothetical protein
MSFIAQVFIACTIRVVKYKIDDWSEDISLAISSIRFATRKPFDYAQGGAEDHFNGLGGPLESKCIRGPIFGSCPAPS